MLISQSFTQNKSVISGKRYKYMDGYLSRDFLYLKIHPLRDAELGEDCLTPLRILKIKTVRLKKDSGNGVKNCSML